MTNLRDAQSNACEEWAAYCKSLNLPCLSMDDFLSEYWDTLTPTQRTEVQNHIDNWDAIFAVNDDNDD